MCILYFSYQNGRRQSSAPDQLFFKKSATKPPKRLPTVSVLVKHLLFAFLTICIYDLAQSSKYINSYYITVPALFQAFFSFSAEWIKVHKMAGNDLCNPPKIKKGLDKEKVRCYNFTHQRRRRRRFEKRCPQRAEVAEIRRRNFQMKSLPSRCSDEGRTQAQRYRRRTYRSL